MTKVVTIGRLKQKILNLINKELDDDNMYIAEHYANILLKLNEVN